MVQVLYRTSTRAILAYGFWSPPLNDATFTTVVVNDALIPTLAQPGPKVYEVDGTITVQAASFDPPLPVPNWGGDNVTTDQVVQAVSDIRAFIALPTPTNAQVVVYIKLLGRAVLYLLRRFFP